MAHALKSIGEKRGWDHGHHQNIRDISSHLGKECNRGRDFQLFIGAANDMHLNFNENEEDLDQIHLAIENAEKFVAELDQLRDAPLQPFTIETPADQRRFGWLLGIPPEEFQRRLPIGTNDPHGISRSPNDNGHAGGGASPAMPPPPGGPPLRLGESVCPTTPRSCSARYQSRWKSWDRCSWVTLAQKLTWEFSRWRRTHQGRNA